MAHDHRTPLDMHPDRLTEQSRIAVRREFDRHGTTPPQLGDDPVLDQMKQAASALYSGLSELYQRLDTVDRDTTRTDNDKKRLKGQIRDTHAGGPAKRVDAAKRAAETAINEIEMRIKKGLRDTLSYEEGKEIRDYIRSQKSPVQFLHSAANSGDLVTLAAVLSHRPYLSGLTDEQQAQIREYAVAVTFPEDAARRTLLAHALDRLERNMDMYTTVQASMVDTHEAQRLERERAEADQALERPLEPVPEPGEGGEETPEGGAEGHSAAHSHDSG